MSTTTTTTTTTTTGATVNTMEPVTSDGLVRKRVTHPGEGDPAGRGAKVTVKYTLRVAPSPSSSSSTTTDSTSFNSVVDTNDNLTFTQGRKKVIAALDAVVPTMSVGEQCIVDAAPAYAFGRRGLKRKNIAPDSHVQLDVHLLAAEGGEEKKALGEMNSRELYEQALRCKEAGNALFKEVKFEKAMVQYSQCIRFVNHLNFKPKPKQQQSEVAKKEEEEEEQPQQLDNPQKIVEEGETNDDAAQTNGTFDSETAQDETVAASKTSDGAYQNEDGSGAPDVQQLNGTLPVTQNDDNEGQGFTEATVSDELAHQGNTTTDTPTTTHAGEAAAAAAEEEIVTLDATTGTVFVDSLGQQQSDGDATGETETETATGATAAVETTTESAVNGELSSAEMNGKSNANEENEEEEEEEDVPDDKDIKGLHVTALNNLSLCLVKMEDYKRAVESASVAIQIDPGNSKAYYYRYVLSDYSLYLVQQVHIFFKSTKHNSFFLIIIATN